MCISRPRLHIQMSLISHVSGGFTRLLLLAEGDRGVMERRRRLLNAVPTSRGVVTRYRRAAALSCSSDCNKQALLLRTGNALCANSCSARMFSFKLFTRARTSHAALLSSGTAVLDCNTSHPSSLAIQTSPVTVRQQDTPDIFLTRRRAVRAEEELGAEWRKHSSIRLVLPETRA